ncbi:MAG: hypothetical protein QOI27_2507 [Gaiellaceae bacterium]|jgi:hypothetical protein|nr:hypothetical protein [Gaiellaceae bacterium]MDX6473759.1 hypothetical protein [Gaiellaceae bacterium]
MGTFELEALPELEGAAPVWRAAYPAGEGETEAFFENLAEYAVGGGGRGGLGGVAAGAARAALSSGVPLGQLGTVRWVETNVIDGELEGELESAGVTHEMMMEHFGHAAAEAETEAEAEAFLFPLVPLAAKFLLPKVASFAMKKIAPKLIRGALNVSKTLRRNPSTRPLVRVMPTIVRRTVADVARQVERGRPVTPDLAARYLAGETRRVLQDPQTCVNAYRRSRALDRQYHTICRRVYVP